jgi:cyclophilin family peptidyl-prolyl cis-trans isomerase
VPPPPAAPRAHTGCCSRCRILYGEQARFFEDELNPKLRHKAAGTIGMAAPGPDMNASQFYITLGACTLRRARPQAALRQAALAPRRGRVAAPCCSVLAWC